MSAMARRLARISETMDCPPRWAASLVLAENEWGDLYVPCNRRRHRHAEPWWCRPLNPRYPAHWAPLLTTFVTGWIVPIEEMADG